MISDWLSSLPYHFALAIAGLFLDALLGDPVYAWHPVRLLGRLLQALENRLRALGANGYAGGMLLFLGLAAATLWPYGLGLWLAAKIDLWEGWPPWLNGFSLRWILDAFLAYSLFALRDLLNHASRVNRAAQRGDLPAARWAVSMLVGRDTDKLNAPACRRAAMESVAENLTDGVIAPMFWLFLGGIPGLLIFKIASTMDSMVGYRTERYLRFGWFGARFDDVLCWVPARITFLLFVALGFLLPGFSGLKAWRIGRKQHHLLPGPNPGWAEATAAGALQRRLIGPVWKNGILVTEIWIGEAQDPEGGGAEDLQRMTQLAIAATLLFTACLGLATWVACRF